MAHTKAELRKHAYDEAAQAVWTLADSADLPDVFSDKEQDVIRGILKNEISPKLRAKAKP